jgi:hypothetical protein
LHIEQVMQATQNSIPPSGNRYLFSLNPSLFMQKLQVATLNTVDYTYKNI